jgi:transposase
MGCVDAEWLSLLLLLPDDMVIEAVYPSARHLTVQVACRLQSAACPLCQQSSKRIHGSYGRTVADVPCGGRRVTLALTIRKFVCGTPDCPRKIITLRLPALAQSYARMTNRLSEALQSLGFATCGEVGGGTRTRETLPNHSPAPLSTPRRDELRRISEAGATRQALCSL